MNIVTKKYINTVKKQMLEYDKIRKDVITVSNEALHHSKRAIFALHRDNMNEAREKMDQAARIFQEMAYKYKKERKAFFEGSFKAAAEEYVEADLFFQFIESGKIAKVRGLQVSPEIFTAGLCDVPGELYRYAVKAATDNDLQTVKKCATAGQEIIGELIEFNLTKYLRTKFDQAKSAVQRLEGIVYDLSLRKDS
ncbi:MAG: hypothetical protein GF349_04855 [Candidatus Magasanikbacteria bacterium]|nr:hypothetical protein [Candidatus Magasanikbacteria bacterium]